MNVGIPNCGPPRPEARIYLSESARNERSDFDSLSLASQASNVVVDICTGRRILAKTLALQDLRLTSASPLTKLSLSHIKLRSTLFAVVRHYGQTNLQYSLTEADVLIDVALAGNIQHRHDANSELISPKVATFHAPGIVHYRCTPTGYHSLFLKIPRDAIETHLARLLQRPIRHPLAFEASLNLAVEGQRLWQLLNWMCCETGQNEPQQPQSIACRIEKLLFDMLLYTYPNNYSAALKAIKSTIIPRQLRAVIQAIRESPEQNWTLTNMAQRADISVRTLCELFRNFRACTPMEFLRSVRLTRTHEEFKQLGPRTSVAEVAKRWGFCHPGRFAAAYTKTFGEAPSDTLRGSRRNGSP